MVTDEVGSGVSLVPSSAGCEYFLPEVQPGGYWLHPGGDSSCLGLNGGIVKVTQCSDQSIWSDSNINADGLSFPLRPVVGSPQMTRCIQQFSDGQLRLSENCRNPSAEQSWYDSKSFAGFRWKDRSPTLAAATEKPCFKQLRTLQPPFRYKYSPLDCNGVEETAQGIVTNFLKNKLNPGAGDQKISVLPEFKVESNNAFRALQTKCRSAEKASCRVDVAVTKWDTAVQLPLYPGGLPRQGSAEQPGDRLEFFEIKQRNKWLDASYALKADQAQNPFAQLAAYVTFFSGSLNIPSTAGSSDLDGFLTIFTRAGQTYVAVYIGGGVVLVDSDDFLSEVVNRYRPAPLAKLQAIRTQAQQLAQAGEGFSWVLRADGTSYGQRTCSEGFTTWREYTITQSPADPGGLPPIICM